MYNMTNDLMFIHLPSMANLLNDLNDIIRHLPNYLMFQLVASLFAYLAMMCNSYFYKV